MQSRFSTTAACRRLSTDSIVAGGCPILYGAEQAAVDRCGSSEGQDNIHGRARWSAPEAFFNEDEFSAEVTKPSRFWEKVRRSMPGSLQSPTAQKAELHEDKDQRTDQEAELINVLEEGMIEGASRSPTLWNVPGDFFFNEAEFSAEVPHKPWKLKQKVMRISRAIPRRSSLPPRSTERRVTPRLSRVFFSNRVLPQSGLQAACGKTENLSAPCDSVCKDIRIQETAETFKTRDGTFGVSCDRDQNQEKAKESKHPRLVVVSPNSLRMKIGKRIMKRIGTKRERQQAERKSLEAHSAAGESDGVLLDGFHSAQRKFKCTTPKSEDQEKENQISKLFLDAQGSKHGHDQSYVEHPEDELTRRVEEAKLSLEREFRQRLEIEFQRLQRDHQQKPDELTVRYSRSKKGKNSAQVHKNSNLRKTAEFDQERQQLAQGAKECQKQMDHLRRERRLSAAKASALEQQKKQLEQEHVRLLQEVEGLRKQHESKRIAQEVQQQLEKERAHMDQERLNFQNVRIRLQEEQKILEKQKSECQIEMKKLREERLKQEANLQAEIQQRLGKELTLVQQERLDCQHANARLQEERQHVEQHKLDCQIERKRLQQECEQNVAKGSILDQQMKELEEERLAFARHIEQMQQQHEDRMRDELKRATGSMDEASSAAEAERNKLQAEMQSLHEERQAFAKEQKLLEQERERQQQILADVEQRRRNEEQRLAEIVQKQRTFQSAAALATADHSADIDSTLTDVRQRAMAKAAAFTKKIGSVVFQQLLDTAVHKLDARDARLFQDQLAFGDILDMHSISICTPEHECYGMRGGKPHFKPAGWVRCGLANADVIKNRCSDWCVAYHGTTSTSALRIMLHGLKRPGQSGVAVAHGQVHSETGASIYVSPSIEYAAFPCYSQIFKLGEEHWAQLVLECRVRPGAFKEAQGTLSSNKHWPADVPIDPNFQSLDGLEWLLECQDDVMISALLIQEFGQGADPSIYGDLVTKVKSPEYVWTEVRVQNARVRSAP